MELKDYTIEELKAELKRRAEEKRAKKAEAYDEAIERLRNAFYDNNGRMCEEYRKAVIRIIEPIFSELKESKDEKIRKCLIDFFEDWHKDRSHCWGIAVTNILAWLEKQGEKVEPIEGFNSEFERQISHLIASIINKEYEYTEAFIKWTSDAFLNYAKRELEKQAGRKSSWSEEEEKNIDRIIDTILCAKSNRNGIPKALYTDEILDELVDWLKFLKDRVQPQPKQEWSEEDCNQIETIACHLDNIGNGVMAESLLNIMDKYKSHRPQPKVGLTKLDKNILEAAIAFVEQNNHFNCWGGVDKHTVLSALRSIRYQNRWKPSKEQIIALRWILNNVPYCTHKEEISGLLEQIKDFV